MGRRRFPLDTVYGVLLHRDMWRREGDGVWPLRNVVERQDEVETKRLLDGPPALYTQLLWHAELIDFVTLHSASGHRHNGYLCRLLRRAT